MFPSEENNIPGTTTQAPDYSAGVYVAPQYQAGADAHNMGNGNFAISDPTTWAGGIESAAKFVAVSAASGLNSFYNTGVTVSNWLGSDAEQNDIAVQLADIDDDLGKYYKENKEYADIAGFMMTALVPGLAGIKLLNAGQKALRAAEGSGIIGSNMARATGLLAPNVEAYTIRAGAQIAEASSTFKLLQGGTLKALGAGFHQAALESAAFEIAVGATMFKSPVLEGQDVSDLVKNIAVGTALGAGIGGVIAGAGIYGQIKQVARRTSAAEKPYTDTTNLVGLTPAQRIIARQEHIESIPAVPELSAILEGKVPGTKDLMGKLSASEAQKVAENMLGKLGRIKSETENSMTLKNRVDIHEITAGQDTEIANQVADMLVGVKSDQLINNLAHLTELGRTSVQLGEEKVLASFRAKQLKNATDLLDEEAVLAKAPVKIGYLNLKGEEVGAVSFERPKFPTLADDSKSVEDVKSKIRKFGFKEDTPWDARVPASIQEAEARYLWADKVNLEQGAKIGEFDIPLLERAMSLNLPDVTVLAKEGNFELYGASQIQKHLETVKTRAAYHLQAGDDITEGITNIEISRITNMRVSTLDGEVHPDSVRNYFNRQTELADYEKRIMEQGLPEPDKLVQEYPFKPSVAKVAYDTKSMKDVNGMEIQGMAYIRAKQKQYSDGVNNVAAAYIPQDLFSQLAHPTDMQLLAADRFGSGPGLLTSANSNYGTLGSTMESIGGTTARIQQKFKADTTSALESHAYAIGSDQEVAIGFEAINKAITSSSEQYGITADGLGIKPLKILDWEGSAAKGKNRAKPQLQEGAAEYIPFNNPKVAEAWIARTELTSSRTSAYQDLHAAQGLENNKDIRALRPIRPDPKDFPFYAMVTDESVSGVGHSSMIHAASAQQLDQMIAKVPSNLKVWKGAELNDYHKAYGQFDYNLSLHENYIDSTIASKGVSNPYFPMTDPEKISKRFLQDHLQSDDIFAREIINAKYEKEFSYLRQQGEAFASTEKSRYTGFLANLEATSQNPYVNYIKTALNVSQVSEYPLLAGLNNKLDFAVSKTWNTITDTFRAAKTPAELAKTNELLEKAGVKTAYYDAQTELLANHTADKGVLRNFVSTANSILATTILRLDPLNAINNVIGSTVAYGAETKAVINAINRGDKEAVGELAGLLKMDVPSQSLLSNDPALRAQFQPDQVNTAGKLMMNAIKNWTDKDAKTITGIPLKEFYKANGWSTRLIDQFHDVLDNITLRGTESTQEITSRIGKIFEAGKNFADKGEKLTGNKFAEELNRFISADTMRQLSDIGVSRGLISPEEQISYINTFVNRAQGNITASQRPLMFQGPIGQSVGLFQTYQFNLMQQVFRHVAEGQGKDAAMLLGLQGTIYGMNGLPAFNFINTSIVGNASGNKEHRDLYDTTYGIAGKSIGDMLIYGIPSNLLKANLYSRGDINPRSVTVLPLNPAEIPYVQATARLYDNVKGMLSTSANGASIWQTLLGGIEHNGLSRPLAGIAQTFQALTHDGVVFSTSKKGNMNGSNDLFSWATATRLAGGKPLDEAIVNDATFRITSYQAADRQKMDSLNKAVKATVISGGIPTDQQYAKFAALYAEAGGKTTNFNKYMLKQMKEVDQTRADQIVNDLKSPYSQKMQNIMGGTGSLTNGDLMGMF